MENIRRVQITNMRGLHARASSKFVNLADSYDAEIRVEKDGNEVCGTSIMGLLMLAAAKGDHINIGGTGPDIAVALDAIQELVEDKFGEDREEENAE